MSEMTEIVDSGPTDDRGTNYTVDDNSKVNGCTSTVVCSASYTRESESVQQWTPNKILKQNPKPMSNEVQSMVDSLLMKEKGNREIRKAAVVKTIAKKPARITSRRRKCDGKDPFTTTLRSRTTSLASLVEYSTTPWKTAAVGDKTLMSPKLAVSSPASNRKENGGDSSPRILRRSRRCAYLLPEEFCIQSELEAVAGKSLTPPKPAVSSSPSQREENRGELSTRILRSSGRLAEITAETETQSKAEAQASKYITPPKPAVLPSPYQRKQNSGEPSTRILRSSRRLANSITAEAGTQSKAEALVGKSRTPPKPAASQLPSERKENGGDSSTRILRSSGRSTDSLVEKTGIQLKVEVVADKSFTPIKTPVSSSPSESSLFVGGLSENKPKVNASLASAGSKKSFQNAALNNKNVKSSSTLTSNAALRDDSGAEYKVPKIEPPTDEMKCILTMWGLICYHKHSHLFLVSPDDVLTETIQRNSKDLNTLKQDIDSGIIHTVKRFETYLYYMFLNAIMMESASSAITNIREMERDSYKIVKRYKRVFNIVSNEADGEADYIDTSNLVSDLEYDSDDTTDSEDSDETRKCDPLQLMKIFLRGSGV